MRTIRVETGTALVSSFYRYQVVVISRRRRRPLRAKLVAAIVHTAVVVFFRRPLISRNRSGYARRRRESDGIELRRRRHPNLWLLVASIFMFIGLYFLVALLTTNFVYLAGSQAHKGLARLFLHFWGLVTVAVVLLNCPDEGGTAPEMPPSS